MTELLRVTASQVSAQLRRAGLNPGRYSADVREGTRVKQAGDTAVTVVFSYDFARAVLPHLVKEFTETLQWLGYTTKVQNGDDGRAAFINVTRLGQPYAGKHPFEVCVVCDRKWPLEKPREGIWVFPEHKVARGDQTPCDGGGHTPAQAQMIKNGTAPKRDCEIQ